MMHIHLEYDDFGEYLEVLEDSVDKDRGQSVQGSRAARGRFFVYACIENVYRPGRVV